MRVLVTGAGGFIGHHLVRALAQRGDRVRAMVHYNAADHWGRLELLEPPILRQIEVFPGDVTDPTRVEEAMRDCELVYHLAALIAIPYSYRTRYSFTQANVLGTKNVLEAALRLKTPRLVCTSTSEVYGTAQSVPMGESHPLHPQSPYAASKAAADHLASSYHLSFGLPVVLLRPFNVFGPGQSLRSVIPSILFQLAEGDRVETGNLDAVRDFTFVTDTVEAFLRAGSTDGLLGRVWNVGTGTGRRIGDILAQAARIAGRALKVEPVAERGRPPASEVERLVCDATAFRTLTGWQPRVAFEAGLAETYRWIADHRDLYKRDRYVI